MKNNLIPAEVRLSANTLNLKNISNFALDQNLKSLISKERSILTDVLLHIVEVDRRKLYLSLAYPNLFEYLTKHIGYSNGSAQRRIDAARLSHETPEIVIDLENGSLNLSQVSLLQKAIRQTQVESKTKVTAQAKTQVLSELKNKSIAQSEVLISQAFNLQIKESPSIKHQQNESVRFEVTLSKQQWEKIVYMRELLSNSLPHGSWDQVLEYVAEKVILQKDKSLKKRSYSKKMNASAVVQSTKSIKGDVPEMPFAGSVRKHVERSVLRQIFTRDKCCQFEDPKSGKKCDSTWQLSLDHIQPVWAGGANSAKNLRILCANHNRQNYRLQAGLR